MVSSKDVAKHANVSQTTVSRVLNNPNQVNPTTREKVLHSIKELNYRPNSIARSLVNKETMSIALISERLHNPFFAESTTSIVDFANSKGFSVNVHFADAHDNTNVYQSVLNQQVDGIILSSILLNDPFYDELIQRNIPFIMFNRRHVNLGNFVEMNNYKAGYIATEYIIQHNHSDIIWIGGNLTTSTFHGRHKGFLDAMKHYQIQVNDSNTIITNTTRLDVHEKIIKAIARKKRPTAIIAATDSIALYVMDILGRNDYQIPNDISVIGIDNVSYSKHHSIQLSTVGTIDEINIGKLAIQHLIDLINEKNNEIGVIQETIDVQLFQRGTVKDK